MGYLKACIASIFFVLFCDGANGQSSVYRVCSSPSYAELCQAVETGDSPVECVTVSDTVNCLLKMEKQEADFVVLTAEEALLAAAAQPEKYSVLASVRHQDRTYQNFAFEAVAVVKADHKGGLQGLSKGGLCHPGYGKSKEQLWSNRVLKHFEKATVASSQKCSATSKSSAEDEAAALSAFYSAACRPGPWLLDPEEDRKLKMKYPKLCSLCTMDGTSNCEGYSYFEPRAFYGGAANPHLSAMACLRMGKGSVAYMAYNHFQDFFKNNVTEIADYALLCENGTTIPLGGKFAPSSAPCAWVRQPWAALVARKDIAAPLLDGFRKWMPTGRDDSTGTWTESLDAIMFREASDLMTYETIPKDLNTYITAGRALPSDGDAASCRKPLRWCTASAAEARKCEWVRRAARSVGVAPAMACVLGASHVDCLAQVRDRRADFAGIDTNLGYLARRNYELTAVLYTQTIRGLTSRVLALVKNGSDITRFENLRDKNACFPEYGGIAWAAFVRTARDRKVISSTECDYANEVALFFGGACAPGAKDPAHFPSRAVDPARLCDGCRGFTPRSNEQGVVSAILKEDCPADPSNQYYGTTGALRCLAQFDSNVAFIEGQYLKEKAEFLKMNPNDFRVLCRNGSLAVNPGFDVDENCALSVTIDGEVVARRDFEDMLSLQLFIQELENWFGYSTGTALVNLKIFSPFDGIKDLLFKDSTIAVATKTSENEYVKNYIDLHKHTDSCSGATAGVSRIFLPALTSLLMLLAVKALAA